MPELLHPIQKPVERPVLFQGAMVRAILRDVEPKTQTRRLVKPQPDTRPGMNCTRLVFKDRKGAPLLDEALEADPRLYVSLCPYGMPGDLLWVKETFYAFGRWETRFSAEKGRDEWHFIDMTVECGHAYHYDVNDPVKIVGAKGRSSITPMWWKRPAIFMPRPASRILLEVTGVRVERLWDISDADVRAEGCEGTKLSYAKLWDSINGAPVIQRDDEGREIGRHFVNWDANPWVWVVEFKRVTP